MDFLNSWKDIEMLVEQSPNLDAEKAISSKGKGMVGAMIRGLKIKLIWIIIFVLSFMVGLFLLKENELAVFVLLFFLVCYLIGGILLSRQIKRLEQEERSFSNLDTLHYLKKQHEIISSIVRTEMRAGSAFMPFAALGGALMGISFDGQTLKLSNNDLIIIFILVGVGTVLGILLSKWMTKLAFGEKLHLLQEQIDLLEEVN